MTQFGVHMVVSRLMKFGPISVSCRIQITQKKYIQISREHTHVSSGQPRTTNSKITTKYRLQHIKFDLLASQHLASGYDGRTPTILHERIRGGWGE